MLKAGQRLQEKRLEKNLSLEEISQGTKIKREFLEYIERGEYNKLPSVSHAQGFVRNYASFLGIPEKEILPLFRREYDQESVYKVLPKGFEAKDDFPLKGFKIRQAFIVLFLIFILFTCYILYQYRYAFINPPLSVTFPEDRQVITATEITVTGKTDSDATVYVNKDAVSVDQAGNFKKTISVFPGNFSLTIKAVNRFGKESEIKEVLEIKPPS